MENIELRSEKVRGIIGEIPHFIIRVGISVILLVIVILFIICYAIKVPTIVECDIKERKADKLLIATDNMHKISVNDTYELKYNDVVIYSDTIKGVDETAIIDNQKILYNIIITLPDTIKSIDNKVIVTDFSSLKATIKTGEKRLLHKYFPFLERL